MSDLVQERPAAYALMNESQSPSADTLLSNLDLWTSAIRASGRGGKRKGRLELVGIKKLRELILELAVRGKLVPQDPADEPASVLLQRIDGEKARLVAKGELRKQRPLPSISNESRPFDSPEGWQVTRLGEVCLLISGQHLKADEYTAQKKTACIPYLTGPAEFGDHHPEPTRFTVHKRSVANDGDILITCKGSGIGKTNVANQPIAISRQLMAVRPILVDRNFVHLTLKTLEDKFRGKSIGIAIPGISREDVNEAIFDLPPVSEQKRIVAKVDELMALCDQLEQQSEQQLQAHEQLVETLLGTLTSARDAKELASNWQRLADHFDLLFGGALGGTAGAGWAIDRLKDTILQLAVMGKLVPQDPKDEPASALLERIQKEKARLMAEGKLKKQNSLAAITESEMSFGTPRGWEWCRLAQAFDVRDGTHDTPKYHREGIPLVTSKNLASGVLDFTDVKYISKQDHENIRKRSAVDRNDILFAMIGTIGNPVLVDTDQEFSIKNVGLFKPVEPSLANMHYLRIFLLVASDYLRRTAAGGVQKFSSLSMLRNLCAALPPLAEQHRIVAKVHELFALCDQLKAKLQTAGETQLKLTDAVVERALSTP